jgi:hypothetical protein
VAALHAADRLHRDIKPSNVLVTEEPRVVLVDFGLIAEIGRADGALAGTPAYAAPEQAAGAAGPASDWYAVGVVLHELLTGGLPFVGSSRAILFDKQRAEPQPVLVRSPGAPPDLAALCDALLRREPRDRPTGAEVLRRLDVAQPRLAARAPVDPDALLVGRDDALATLRAAFADAERGRCTAVHVRGVSGIGKTALLRAFMRELEREPGRGRPRGPGLPAGVGAVQGRRQHGRRARAVPGVAAGGRGRRGAAARRAPARARVPGAARRRGRRARPPQARAAARAARAEAARVRRAGATGSAGPGARAAPGTAPCAP